MTRKIFFMYALLGATSLITSCDSNRIFEENKSIPESGWNVMTLKKFEVDIKDPSTPANFYINVRNADGYPYYNLSLYQNNFSKWQNVDRYTGTVF
ncbi:MAG: hypothetical protein IPH89_00650 [Bacteroidetes bacterium]|nr:hypothetical protein [Bacteroidota bacterium]